MRVTFGLMTDDVAVCRAAACSSRYSALVIGHGVGERLDRDRGELGAETAPDGFVAVMVRLITEGRIWSGGRIGVVKVTVAPVPGGLAPWVTTKLFRRGAPAW